MYRFDTIDRLYERNAFIGGRAGVCDRLTLMVHCITVNLVEAFNHLNDVFKGFESKLSYQNSTHRIQIKTLTRGPCHVNISNFQGTVYQISVPAASSPIAR